MRSIQCFTTPICCATWVNATTVCQSRAAASPMAIDHLRALRPHGNTVHKGGNAVTFYLIAGVAALGGLLFG